MKLSVVCAPLRRWIYEAQPFVGRTSDLEAWKLQSFSSLVSPATGIRGLADKGMNDASEPRLVTPFKKTQVTALCREVGDNAAAENRVSRACNVFNMDLGSLRVYNEIMIGDLMRWGAARGCSSVKTYSSLFSAKLRIEMCGALCYFLYRQRGQG